MLLLCICVSSNCFSQINEIGFFVGGTNYVGDVGRTNYIQPNNPGGTILYKYNVNPRIALRGTVSRFSLLGDDSESENAIRRARGFKFQNQVNEIAVGIEYNFFEYDLSSTNKISTPYILLQVAAVDYETPRLETSPGNYRFTRNTSVAIPFGLGFKTKVYGKIAFAVEASFRYTFTDKLDYSTSQFPALDFGGTSNDWYMFTGVSLVYTFGRPSCFANRR
ncbi:DUF6089 family protein [Pseudotenacibaculum sp. MALMAid0570]|uniref:type IX secretion system protein PorG n=1 Tax=Pseudotenacibaculum sp. MALMAid0570 TaxID=3143938 RepID=UPI0032E04360